MYYIEKLKRVNSKSYSPTGIELPEIIDVQKYLEANGITPLHETPYIFTHIKLSDGSIVVQKYNGLTCSPTKLKEAIIK